MNSNIKRNWTLILLPLVLAAGVGGGLVIGHFCNDRSNREYTERLNAMLQLIDGEYVDNVNIDSLLEATYPELLAGLDPHCVYISTDELERTNNELQGSFSGVGVSFQIISDTVRVVEVIPDGPAEKVGIMAGDRIIEANGKKLTGPEVTGEDVFKTLRGDKGSKVVMKIKRTGTKNPVTFDVIRDDIPVNSVDTYYMIDDGIGYVKVNTFSRNTSREFFTALLTLKEQGAGKFIIDLRGNSGGFLDQVEIMANEFLPTNSMVVYTKGRKPGYSNEFRSNGRGKFLDTELVVLIDEESASASEIFAGAIQDNDRGLVIGRRSFGKGLVQQQFDLPGGAAVRLTVSRYYTPSGRSIQRPFDQGLEHYLGDLSERYRHGELYCADSIKLDRSRAFTTTTGRKVYGGGGIMPDIFVPLDTTGITSYYMNVSNQGLIQKFAYNYTDRNRSRFQYVKNIEQFERALPTDQALLESFVEYAVSQGVPARWYYINQSRELLLSQLKAVIARDVLGYSAMGRILNRSDVTVNRALQELKSGHSPIKINP